MTGGHFVSRLAIHFGVLGGEDPVGFEVDVTRLLVIDADYLVTRLGICNPIMGSYYWVPLGPARQVVDDPEQEDPQGAPAAAPAQEEPEVPPPPPPVPRTIGQRVERVEVQLRSLRGVVDGSRADIDVVRRDIGWLVGSISQILENAGINHHRPDGTFFRGMRRYSRLPTRRVRPRMDDASTSGTQSAEDTDDIPPP